MKVLARLGELEGYRVFGIHYEVSAWPHARARQDSTHGPYNFFNFMSHVALNCIYPIGFVGQGEIQELVLYVHVSHCTVPPILLYCMYH